MIQIFNTKLRGSGKKLIVNEAEIFQFAFYFGCNCICNHFIGIWKYCRRKVRRKSVGKKLHEVNATTQSISHRAVNFSVLSQFANFVSLVVSFARSPDFDSICRLNHMPLCGNFILNNCVSLQNVQCCVNFISCLLIKLKTQTRRMICKRWKLLEEIKRNSHKKYHTFSVKECVRQAKSKGKITNRSIATANQTKQNKFSSCTIEKTMNEIDFSSCFF